MSRPNLLGSYGAWAEEMAAQPGDLAFSRTVAAGTMSLDDWKTAGRERVLDSIGSREDVAGAAPTARTTRKFRFDGLDVEELRWQLPHGPVTEAVLLLPAGARGPLPGVLALHDHGCVKRFGFEKIVRTGEKVPPVVEEHRRRYYGGAAWANELAHRGFCVLAHDVFPFGSRRVLAADVPPAAVQRLLADPTVRVPPSAEGKKAQQEPPVLDPCRESAPEDHARYEGFAERHEDVLAKSLLALGVTFPGITLSEDRAALAVLAARPEVDPQRLGCCGLSGGGLRACFLGGLSDSLRCAVTAGFMSTWKDFALWNGAIHTWGLFAPHLARSLDFPEILALRAPLPSLVLACDGDLIFDQGEVRRAEQLLAAVYRRAGAADREATVRFAGPHRFDTTMQEEAFRWLSRWLGRNG